MNIEFRYSQHYDLVLHALAYLKVNNASNLYSQQYIQKMEQNKQSPKHDMPQHMRQLEEYYNDNFERLAVINFLPYYAYDYENMRNMFMNYQYFSPRDKTCFVDPFVKILDAECTFFFDYWNSLHKSNESIRHIMEEKFKTELQKYSCIFDYYSKTAVVLFSYNTTRNGRGIFDNNSFSALVPFPDDADKFNHSFIQLLHEYTHQFTDPLLKSNIQMKDGSHNLSESLVILADYYLIKVLNDDFIKPYFQWLSTYGVDPSESNLHKLFPVNEGLTTELKKLIDNILLS